MNKKQYEKPSVEVVVLKQEQSLLAGSPKAQAGVQDVTMYNVPEE